MSRESVDRADIVRRIHNGPNPTGEATAMIGAMVSIIEADKGRGVAAQILTELARIEKA